MFLGCLQEIACFRNSSGVHGIPTMRLQLLFGPPDDVNFEQSKEEFNISICTGASSLPSPVLKSVRTVREPCGKLSKVGSTEIVAGIGHASRLSMRTGGISHWGPDKVTTCLNSFTRAGIDFLRGCLVK